MTNGHSQFWCFKFQNNKVLNFCFKSVLYLDFRDVLKTIVDFKSLEVFNQDL